MGKQFGMYDLPDEMKKLNKTVEQFQRDLANEEKSRKREFLLNFALSLLGIFIAIASLFR